MSTNGTLVVLKLDGDLAQQGFRVALEIGPEGNRPTTELLASLPPDRALIEALNQWQQSYRSLDQPNRIVPQEITYGGSVNWRTDCQRAAAELHNRFHCWLDAPSFRPVDRRLRMALNVQEPIRILLRTQDQNLRQLPWQVWELVEQYPLAEVAIGALAIERITSAKATPDQSGVRILTILGDQSGIHLETDRILLEQLPDAEVTLLKQPDRQQFNQHLWQYDWDLLFFAGHSQTEGNRGRIYLNPQENLTLEELKYGLRQAIARGLQLAIFNSCDGLGLAQELEHLHLPQLIVMREPVPDPVAQAFLQYFLTEFQRGESLYLAVRRAREQLQGLEGNFPCASWLPVLCQNSTEQPLTWQKLLRSGELTPDRAPFNLIALPLSKPSRRRFSRWQRVLVASFAVTSLVMGCRWLGALQPLELFAYDWMMKFQATANTDPRLLVVTVNDRDVEEFKKPLSDRTVHQLLTKLEQYQPRVIGLDIYRDYPQRQGWNDLVKYLQTSDRVVALCQVGELGELPAIPPPPGVPKERLGFSDALAFDGDQAMRRYILAMDVGESACGSPYSFSFQVVRRFLPQDIRYEFQSGSRLIITPLLSASTLIELVRPNLGGYRLAQNDASSLQILIAYRSTQVAQQVSLTEILQGKPEDLQHWVKDRIVLIGYVGKNTNDYHPTPLGELPGVMVHAHVVNQLLATVLERQPLISSWTQAGDAVWVWLWAIVGGIIAGWLANQRTRCVSLAATIAVLSASCFLLFHRSLWVPFVPAALAMLLTAGVVIYLQPKRLKNHDRRSKQ